MRAHRGFSLLEVMVAGTVTALGLSGVAALLLASVAGTSQAHLDTRAAMLARHLAATIAMSPDTVSTFLSGPHVSTTDCAQGSSCDAVGFAVYNYRKWRFAVASQLPSGEGLVCRDATPNDGSNSESACDDAGPLTIKVFWTEPGKAGGATHRLSIGVPR